MICMQKKKNKIKNTKDVFRSELIGLNNVYLTVLNYENKIDNKINNFIWK